MLQRKSRGLLRKIHMLGLGRHGFGGWMSGAEMIAQRGLELGEIQEQKSSVQSERLNHVKRSEQGNNVYPLLPKNGSVRSVTHITLPFPNLENDLWEVRKQLVVQIAKRRNGHVRLQEVAAECNVNIRIAADWLRRLAREGMLSLVAGQQNVMIYSMKDVRRLE